MKFSKYSFCTLIILLLAAVAKPASAQFAVIELKIPGIISDEIKRYGYSDVDELQVRGMIDDRDLMAIRRMTFLRYLDLTQTDLRSVPSNAFEQMRYLRNVLFPSRITRIGMMAFQNCLLLDDIRIPNNVTEIGKNAFYNCKSLFSVDIPSGVKKLGAEAFMGCSSLGQVVFLGATSIGARAFAGCSGLKLVVCLSNVPPDVDLSAFEGTPPQRQLGVPADALEAYRQHPEWSKLFETILPATEGPNNRYVL